MKTFNEWMREAGPEDLAENQLEQLITRIAGILEGEEAVRRNQLLDGVLRSLEAMKNENV